jgi:hypothetical protein
MRWFDARLLVTAYHIISSSPQVRPLRNIWIAVSTVQNFSLSVIINSAWHFRRPICFDRSIGSFDWHLLVLLSTQKTGIDWVIPLLVVVHRLLLIFLQINVIGVGCLLETLGLDVLHAQAVTPQFFLITLKSTRAVDFFLAEIFGGRLDYARLTVWIAEHLAIQLLLLLFLVQLLGLQTLFLYNILTATDAWDLLLLFVPAGWDGHLQLIKKVLVNNVRRSERCGLLFFLSLAKLHLILDFTLQNVSFICFWAFLSDWNVFGAYWRSNRLRWIQLRRLPKKFFIGLDVLRCPNITDFN